jgi:hypothetical protein
MGLTYPFYAPAYHGMAMAQASLVGPIYLGLAWQEAWLNLLAQAVREAEKAGARTDRAEAAGHGFGRTPSPASSRA